MYSAFVAPVSSLSQVGEVKRGYKQSNHNQRSFKTNFSAPQQNLSNRAQVNIVAMKT